MEQKPSYHLWGLADKLLQKKQNIINPKIVGNTISIQKITNDNLEVF